MSSGYVEPLMKTFSPISHYPNKFEIQWCLTQNCNLNCSYCTLHKEEEYTNITNFIKFIKNNAPKNANISLFGGEPTSHPNYIDVLEELSTDYKITTFSNLEKSFNFWEKISKINNLEFVFSFHYNGNKKHIKLFLEKLKLFDNEDLTLLIMLEKGYEKELTELALKLKEEKYNVATRRIFGVEYDEEINETSNDLSELYIITNGDTSVKYTRNELYDKNLNNFRLWFCNAQKQKLFIDSNGDVYPCQSYRDIEFKKLTHVNDNKILNKEPTICFLKKCICDLEVYKYKK